MSKKCLSAANRIMSYTAAVRLTVLPAEGMTEKSVNHRQNPEMKTTDFSLDFFHKLLSVSKPLGQGKES